MKIRESARLIIVKDKKSILRNLTNRKSIVPLILGIIIGVCLAKLFIIPSSSSTLWYPMDMSQFHKEIHYTNLMTTTTNNHENNSDSNLMSTKTTTNGNNDKENNDGDDNDDGKIDKSLADKLYNEVRILCWIMTNSTNHETKAKLVKQTWGTRCNKLIFMSDAEDNELGSIDLNVGYGRDVLWAKTKEAFKFVYANYFNDADWFLKADDDTYVILENLRYLLYSYKPEDPIYFGCKFKKFVEQGYMSGGAGYVLSKEALTRFVEVAFDRDDICATVDNNGAEDVEMGKCLQNIGIIAGDSRDSKGRRRFFPFGPDDHYLNLEPYDPNDDYWYREYSFYNISEGLSCCSDYPISFHYVQPNQMHFLDYAIYHIQLFGYKFNNNNVLPNKIINLTRDEITTTATDLKTST